MLVRKKNFLLRSTKAASERPLDHGLKIGEVVGLYHSSKEIFIPQIYCTNRSRTCVGKIIIAKIMSIRQIEPELSELERQVTIYLANSESQCSRLVLFFFSLDGYHTDSKVLATNSLG